MGVSAMADYPTLDLGDNSRIDARGGLIADTAEDGSVRSRRLYTVTQYDLTLVHPHATAAQRSTLLAHFVAHAALNFNWVAPWGETYNVRYLDEPQTQPHTANFWTLTSRLTGPKL